jgi:hypothetical protein
VKLARVKHKAVAGIIVLADKKVILSKLPAIKCQ